MAASDSFTPNEWQSLCAAPAMAGMLVTIADISGPIGLVQEASAMMKAIVETAAQSPSEVVKAIGEAVKDGTKPDLPDLPRDRAQARTTLLDGCTSAAAIVSEKTPGEADAYKTWLVGVARKTAEASKEGGFLGFGGTRVSEGETTAINDLAGALGVNAS